MSLKLINIVGLLNEETIEPPNIPNSMNFWHGGNLGEYNDIIAQKNGRYEYGPGLYLITKYDIAKKYSKGSRKLYLVTVQNGNDINDAFLDENSVGTFIKHNVIGHMTKEVKERVLHHMKDGRIKAFIFNNIILNSKAIRPSKTQNLRQFFISNNIDYEIVNNAFGFGEKMMVLYDMKKIINIKQIKPMDEIVNYDLS
jgi:hypothetical protein